jgi:hypothetical protein
MIIKKIHCYSPDKLSFLTPSIFRFNKIFENIFHITDGFDSLIIDKDS